MSNVTTLEAKVLNLIALDLYQPVNGARPESFDDTGDVWTEIVSDEARDAGVKRLQFAALCSTLTQKGLVRSYQGSTRCAGDDPSTIALTETGFAAWAESNPAKEVR